MEESVDFIKQKLSVVMLDPSLLLDRRYNQYEQIKGDIYIPASFFNLSRREVLELEDFFGLYLTENIHLGYRTFMQRINTIRWQKYDNREFKNDLPANLRNNYENLQEANIPKHVKSILSDEFLFLTTRSSLISRLKKPFKVFEKNKVFPLINLEKSVPPQWAPFISEMKHYANWICFASTLMDVSDYTLIPTSPILASIRLFIIDP